MDPGTDYRYFYLHAYPGMCLHDYLIISIPIFLPEPPRPTLFLDLFFTGLECKLADALSELSHMAAKEAKGLTQNKMNTFIL